MIENIVCKAKRLITDNGFAKISFVGRDTEIGDSGACMETSCPIYNICSHDGQIEVTNEQVFRRRLFVPGNIESLKANIANKRKGTT